MISLRDALLPLFLLLIALVFPGWTADLDDNADNRRSPITAVPGIIDFGSLQQPETSTVMLSFHFPSQTGENYWKVSTPSTWISFDKTSGKFVRKEPQQVRVSLDSRRLEPGFHSTHITISCDADVPLQVPVIVYIEKAARIEREYHERLTVEPANPHPLSPGLERVFRARGYDSEGNKSDITEEVRWICDNSQVAEFREAGVLRGKTRGYAHVYAEKSGMRSEVVSIFVEEPEGPVLGLMVHDTILGRLEANSVKSVELTLENQGSGFLAWQAVSTVSWLTVLTDGKQGSKSGGRQGIAHKEKFVLSLVVNTEGLTAGDYTGALAIRSNGGDRIITFIMTVVTIESVQVTPLRITVPEGQQRRLTATALWSDGSRSDVSASREGRWINHNPSVASFRGRSGLFTALSPGVAEVRRIERGKESQTVLIEVTGIDPQARLRVVPSELEMGVIGPGESSEGVFQMRRIGVDALSWSFHLTPEWHNEQQEPLAVTMTDLADSLKIRLRSVPERERTVMFEGKPFQLKLTVEAAGRSSSWSRLVSKEGFYRDAMRVRYNDRDRTLFFSYEVSSSESRPILTVLPDGLTLGILEPGRVYMPKIRVSNAGKSILNWNVEVQGRRSSFYDVKIPGGQYLSLYNEETGDDHFYRPPSHIADRINLSGWWRGQDGYPVRFGRNDTINYLFEGTGISVRYFKSHEGGSFRAFIDDRYVGEIDCYALAEERSEILIVEGLPGGSHTLTIVTEREGAVRIHGFRTHGATLRKGTGNWIRLSPARGTTKSETDFVNIIINPAGLAPGTYRENILFDSDGGRDIVELSFEVKDQPLSPLIPVYLYTKGDDHLLLSETMVDDEELGHGGYRKEGIAFTLFSPDTPGTAPWYAWHHAGREAWLYSTDRTAGDLEEAKGYRFRGSIGNIALIPLPETRELYRLYNPDRRRYLYTTTLREEEHRRRGFRYDGIAGYVQ